MNFICPSPLAYAYSDKDTTIWAFEQGNCAVPCPSIQITENEYQLQADVFTYMVLITSLITILVLVKMAPRFFIRTMFIVGFFLFAVVALVFVYLDRNDDIVCSGAGHYVKRDPMCVLQAAVFVFSIVWVQCWSVILAYDAYMHILNRLNPQHAIWRRKIYFLLSFFVSLICTIIPLAANNLGFDPYANIPFCLYLFSDDKSYFWGTLFLPFVMLNLLCSLITIAGAIKIQKVFVLSKTPLSQAIAAENDSSRESSRDEFISGHGNESSFGGSVGNNTNRNAELQSAARSTPAPNRLFMTDVSIQSDRETSVISPIALDVPLLSPFDNSYLLEDSARESLGSYLYTRDATPVDPECLTNVTDDVHVVESLGRSIPPPPGLDDTRNSTASGDDARSSGPIASSTGSSKSSLNWLRFWSQASGEATDEITRHGKKISHWEYLIRKTVKYNGRTMLFLVMFCLTTLFVAPILIYLQYIKYDDYMDSGNDFVECLVQASIRCEDQTQSGVDGCAEEDCGKHPKQRANVVEMMAIIVWIAGYGIIPGLVFGTYA